ncbi:MAG: hypothetical protein ACFB0B_06455 [Thermonemataceae bacterium]
MNQFSITLLLFLLVCTTVATAQDKTTLLSGIQARIYDTFEASFKEDESKLKALAQKLTTAWQAEQDRDYAYWATYTYYYLCLYHGKRQNKEKAEAANQQGVKLIKAIPQKTSEDYVMLAKLTGLEMMYDQGQAIALSARAEKYTQKALKLNEQNLRTYLYMGQSDFYRPVEYGGGKVVEKNLLKAISLKDTYSDSPYAPTWGRNEAYATLVQYYLREDQPEKARVYCAKGLKLFPNDYMLNELQKKVK